MKTQVTAALLILALVPLGACGSRDSLEDPAGAGACPSGSPTPASSPKPLAGPTPWPANHGELVELQAKVEEAAGRYPDVFAGTGMDTDADRVFVWRKPSRDFDRAIGELAGAAGRVSFLCAPHSAAELKPMVQRLVGDYADWKAKGLPLHTIWARHDGVCVEVGTQDPARARQELGQAYPSYPLCHVEERR